jgi:hypothetical protein
MHAHQFTLLTVLALASSAHGQISVSTTMPGGSAQNLVVNRTLFARTRMRAD